MARIRYQFDEHLSSVIAVELRRLGIDALTASEAGLRSKPDDEVLASAHAEARVVVTSDQDFLRLDAKGIRHSGIVYSVQGSRSIGEMVEYLLLICEVKTAEEMVGQVE
jgi:hypothetical protein